MEKFLSPTTRLELQRFQELGKNGLQRVAEGTDDREVGASGRPISE